MPIRLALGERIEGYYQTAKSDITLSIQDPAGNILVNYGQRATSNFTVTANTAGFYSLNFEARRLGGLEPGNTMFVVAYTYEIYGR